MSEVIPTGLLRATLEAQGFGEADAISIAGHVSHWLANRGSGGADEFLDTCESPMERMFFLGAFGGKSPARVKEWSGDACRVATVLGLDVVIAAQYKVYGDDEFEDDSIPFARVDFLVNVPGYAGMGSRLAIEIDGHDFHEKTKEQAARDKARDRKITKQGLCVLRFTGSEVFADAAACWAEVFSIIESRIDSISQLRTCAREEILEELAAPKRLPQPTTEAAE